MSKEEHKAQHLNITPFYYSNKGCIIYKKLYIYKYINIKCIIYKKLGIFSKITCSKPLKLIITFVILVV